MKQNADIIFINGSVVTVDSADQICEAAAVVGNRDGKISGSSDTL